MLAELRPRGGRVPGKPAHPARWLQRAVTRMPEAAREQAPQWLGKRVEPLDREAVRRQRVRFDAELVALGVVDGEPQAAHAAERVTGKALDRVERPLAQAPERPSRVAAEVAHGVRVRHCAAAQGEAAVTTARTAGDLPRLVQPDAQPSPCQRQRARAAGDAAADHDHVGRAVERGGGERAGAFSSSQYEPTSRL